GPYYNAAGDGKNGFNDISAAIQVPGYVLIAIAEIFASITGLEYAYKRAPEKMKSIVMSMFLFTNAGGSILAFCFNSISANPYLVENFAIVAGLMGAFTILFFVCFRHYDTREKQENEDRMLKESSDSKNQRTKKSECAIDWDFPADGVFVMKIVNSNGLSRLSTHSLPQPHLR
ncbi:peptide transporter ptr2, partial [Coemansia sp. RSA 1939]